MLGDVYFGNMENLGFFHEITFITNDARTIESANYKTEKIFKQ